jgi:hypothetical protein
VPRKIWQACDHDRISNDESNGQLPAIFSEAARLSFVGVGILFRLGAIPTKSTRSNHFVHFSGASATHGRSIEQGVLDVADSDAAVCCGPGLRWRVMGPNLLFHLVDGPGGIHHFMEHLSGPVARGGKTSGQSRNSVPV